MIVVYEHAVKGFKADHNNHPMAKSNDVWRKVPFAIHLGVAMQLECIADFKYYNFYYRLFHKQLGKQEQVLTPGSGEVNFKTSHCPGQQRYVDDNPDGHSVDSRPFQ